MIKKYFLFIVIIILPISFAQQRKMELEGTNKNDIDLKYLFFLPKDYYSNKKYRLATNIISPWHGRKGI